MPTAGPAPSAPRRSGTGIPRPGPETPQARPHTSSATVAPALRGTSRSASSHDPSAHESPDTTRDSTPDCSRRKLWRRSPAGRPAPASRAPSTGNPRPFAAMVCPNGPIPAAEALLHPRQVQGCRGDRLLRLQAVVPHQHRIGHVVPHRAICQLAVLVTHRCFDLSHTMS